MGFVSSIIVVEEIARSRTLYEKLLGMKVSGDFGIYNVGFEGGLSLYQRALFEQLTERKANLEKNANLAIYFEIDHLEELEKEIAANGFEFVHRMREQPWKQRTFRFYDYDNHILEIAERMDIVLGRLQQEGKPVEEIARLTGYSVDQVLLELEKFEQGHK